MPRAKYRNPKRPRPIKMTDRDLTAKEVVDLAVSAHHSLQWHRRIRRWIRQQLRQWRAPR